jgi:hypothetical protein
MPEGSAAEKNFNEETQDEMGNFLAADKARSAGNLRTNAANDNYQPYTEEPANDNNTPQEEAEEETTADFQAKGGAEQNTKAQQQAQLAEQEQMDIALAMEMSRQRQALQLAKERQKAETELEELEKDLTDFKDSKLGGILKIFQPRLTILIDILIAEMKKQANKLDDKAKIAYYTTLIVTVTSLIAIFRALKFFVAIMDAAVVDKISCLRLIIMTIYTIILPIIILLISIIYVPFLVILFLIGKIPLLKGTLTPPVGALIEKLKKQRAAWEVELEKAKKRVAKRKQIAGLKKAEKKVAQRR